MESTGYRHRRSPSSDRFLGVFSFSPPSSSAVAGVDELNEAEIFWNTDFAEPSHSDEHRHHHRRLDFQQETASGILAVLSEADGRGPFLYQKPSISFPSSSSKAVPMIPRLPERECSQPAAQFRNQSAPMKVPVLSEAMAKRRSGMLADLYDDDDDGGDDRMLPPHELVSRGSGVSPKTTFSVLEGVGRTLKGRDLRQEPVACKASTTTIESPSKMTRPTPLARPNSTAHHAAVVSAAVGSTM
ncbi:protein S40-7-like [Alnus glutinosa]|uniref:protein S40-7-like n=1 Tax=Alnus glutinosa TaxID=3517 RepID=UPI002D77AA6F|nr:protein S40-7-like [Alnus glutinosa]